MIQLVFHKESEREAVAVRRLQEANKRSPLQRWKTAFDLMAFSAFFRKDKKDFFKRPEGKGIVLRQP